MDRGSDKFLGKTDEILLIVKTKKARPIVSVAGNWMCFYYRNESLTFV